MPAASEQTHAIHAIKHLIPVNGQTIANSTLLPPGSAKPQLTHSLLYHLTNFVIPGLIGYP